MKKLICWLISHDTIVDDPTICLRCGASLCIHPNFYTIGNRYIRCITKGGCERVIRLDKPTSVLDRMGMRILCWFLKQADA